MVPQQPPIIEISAGIIPAHTVQSIWKASLVADADRLILVYHAVSVSRAIHALARIVRFLTAKTSGDKAGRADTDRSMLGREHTFTVPGTFFQQAGIVSRYAIE